MCALQIFHVLAVLDALLRKEGVRKKYIRQCLSLFCLFFTTLKMIQTPNYYYLILQDITSTSPDTVILTLSIPTSLEPNENTYVNFIKPEWIRDIQVYSVLINFSTQTVWMKCRRNRYIDLRYMRKPIAVLSMYINIEEAPAA